MSTYVGTRRHHDAAKRCGLDLKTWSVPWQLHDVVTRRFGRDRRFDRRIVCDLDNPCATPATVHHQRTNISIVRNASYGSGAARRTLQPARFVRDDEGCRKGAGTWARFPTGAAWMRLWRPQMTQLVIAPTIPLGSHRHPQLVPTP